MLSSQDPEQWKMAWTHLPSVREQKCLEQWQQCITEQESNWSRKINLEWWLDTGECSETSADFLISPRVSTVMDTKVYVLSTDGDNPYIGGR